MLERLSQSYSLKELFQESIRLGCISKTVIMVLLDEVLKCEAQSVSAEDPPTHNAAQTDRASPSLYLSIPHLFSYHGNGDAYIRLPFFEFTCRISVNWQGDRAI